MKEYRQARFERPAGATEILLVRHGESRAATEHEPFPLVDGQGDPELHADGRDQAERVGLRLRSLSIDAVYVTKLRRTLETAAPLCGHLGLEPNLQPDLHEVHLGEWEGGVMRKKVADGDPIYDQVLAQQRWDVIPGAEPQSEFLTRLRRGIDAIHRAHPNQLVAAFVHGGVVGQLLAHAVSATPFAFNGADNGSISHLVVLGDQWTVRRFNDTAHLSGDLMRVAGAMT